MRRFEDEAGQIGVQIGCPGPRGRPPCPAAPLYDLMTRAEATLFGVILPLSALAFLGQRVLAILDRARGAEWGRPWLNRLDGLNRLLCRYWHRLAVRGLTLPAQGGALFVANHVSGLDPLVMIAAVRRPVRFLIAEDEYNRWWLRWLFRSMKCIPVQPGRSRKAFLAATQALAAGEVVALFPEGGIHPPGQLGRLKRGVALMAEVARVPVYAVRIDGVRGAGLKVPAVFLPDRVSLTGSPPLHVTEQGVAQFLEELALRLQPPEA